MTRHRPFVAALLGAGTLILLPSTAHASQPAEIRTIEVSAEYTEPMPEFDGVECRGFDASGPWCQAFMVGPVTFTGTIAGEAWAESGGPAPDGHIYDGQDIFEHVVIEGCGEGSMILDTPAGTFDFADTRTDDLSTGSSNDWNIRPGSGTDTLAGISGQGVNHWRPYWTETGERWGRGKLTGTITCAVPKNESRGNPRVDSAAVGKPTVAVVDPSFEPAVELSSTRGATAMATGESTAAVLATAAAAEDRGRPWGATAVALAFVALMAAALGRRRSRV